MARRSVASVTDSEIPDAMSAPAATTMTTVTLLDRLVAAGIGRERALSWITSVGTRVEGVVVGDPDAPAPPPVRWSLQPT